jgi:hypothetical protein
MWAEVVDPEDEWKDAYLPYDDEPLRGRGAALTAEATEAGVHMLTAKIAGKPTGRRWRTENERKRQNARIHRLSPNGKPTSPFAKLTADEFKEAPKKPKKGCTATSVRFRLTEEEALNAAAASLADGPTTVAAVHKLMRRRPTDESREIVASALLTLGAIPKGLLRYELPGSND